MSARIRIFLKTEIFLSVFFGHRKRRILKTLSRSDVFENAGYAFTCGRPKTGVFENAGCTLAWWTGKNDSNTLRVEADFKDGEKKLRFQKYQDKCGGGLIFVRDACYLVELFQVQILICKGRSKNNYSN